MYAKDAKSAYLLYSMSDTQRVVAYEYESGEWLIAKEWRHSAIDNWTQGKGVFLPIVSGIKTSNLLGNLLLGNYTAAYTVGDRENENTNKGTESAYKS